ncbi:MAG: hypothetical protein ABIP06_04265 [Pyrinomonadaceae bacterium]
MIIENVQKNLNIFQIYAVSVLARTVEMTWGETDYTQAKSKNTT